MYVPRIEATILRREVAQNTAFVLAFGLFATISHSFCDCRRIGIDLAGGKFTLAAT